ncbi:TPA: hypothetical protein ACH3X3_009985 [Trebouxia sp. C0006]
MVQMPHVEVSKEEKLADTMRGWYANAKARPAEYAQQLAQLEASARATAESSIAFYSLNGDEPQLAASLSAETLGNTEAPALS